MFALLNIFFRFSHKFSDFLIYEFSEFGKIENDLTKVTGKILKNIFKKVNTKRKKFRFSYQCSKNCKNYEKFLKNF